MQDAALPAELSRTEELLQRIHERVVELAETGPIGKWLDGAPVAVPTDADQPTWEEAINSSGADLARGLVRAPAQPEPLVWLQVRRSILDDLAAVARNPVTRKLPGWRIMLAGAAAVAIIGLVALARGSLSPGSSESPTIVFADFVRAPDVDFAVVRYGFRR